MPKVEEFVQAELGSMAERWEQDMNRLRQIHAGLPVSPREEAMLLGEADPDIATEVRSAIECVIPDRLEPAIQALREAASYRPGEEE